MELSKVDQEAHKQALKQRTPERVLAGEMRNGKLIKLDTVLPTGTPKKPDTIPSGSGGSPAQQGSPDQK